MSFDFDKEITKFCEILNYLNDIQKVVSKKAIIDAITLTADRDALMSLCGYAFKAYETTLASLMIRDITGLTECRTNMAHHTETLKGNDTIGFDQTTPQEMWDMHFSSGGCLNRIRIVARSTITKSESISVAVKNKLQKSPYASVVILNSADCSHLPMIENMNASLSKGITCLVGLLFLLSYHQTPPTVIQISTFLKKTVGLTINQIEFLVNELIDKKVLRKSSAEHYLFINDDDFARNAARDFLDNFDVENMIESFEESLDV